MTLRRLFALVAPVLLTAGLLSTSRTSTAAETFSARVVGVTDGDTLTVLKAGNQQVKLRLHGLDAPEQGQPFGATAKEFVSARVFGKTVTVEVVDTDRYGRAVGIVKLDSGESLNLTLVQSGYAWWYHVYGAQEKDLAAAEVDARAARRGLWKADYPVPPWAWRNPTGPLTRATAKPTTKATTTPVRVPVPARSVAKPAPKPAVASPTVYLTRTGAKYHAAGCRYLAKSSIPVTLKDAQARGYDACSVCGGR